MPHRFEYPSMLHSPLIQEQKTSYSSRNESWDTVGCGRNTRQILQDWKKEEIFWVVFLGIFEIGQPSSRRMRPSKNATPEFGHAPKFNL